MYFSRPRNATLTSKGQNWKFDNLIIKIYWIKERKNQLISANSMWTCLKWMKRTCTKWTTNRQQDYQINATYHIIYLAEIRKSQIYLFIFKSHRWIKKCYYTFMSCPRLMSSLKAGLPSALSILYGWERQPRCTRSSTLSRVPCIKAASNGCRPWKFTPRYTWFKWTTTSKCNLWAVILHFITRESGMFTYLQFVKKGPIKGRGGGR